MKINDLREYLIDKYGYDVKRIGEKYAAEGKITTKNGDDVTVIAKPISKPDNISCVQFTIKQDSVYDGNRPKRCLILAGDADASDFLEKAISEHQYKKDDYIVAIEPAATNRPVTLRNLPFSDMLKQAAADHDIGIYKVSDMGPGRQHPCNFVMIRVKEDGKEVTKYMDAYLASSDSRTYQDVRYVDSLSDGSDSKSGNEKKTADEDKPGCDWPHNLLIFGAPGTGKSHCIKEKLDELGWNKNMQRVTFYEDYSYEKFVGAYLPRSGNKTSTIKGKNGENNDVEVTSETKNSIEYRFEPGIFLKMIADAWYDKENAYVLVIEEINRANAASVFGDFFQLLDRNSAGISDYPISIPQDMRDYLLHDYQWEKNGQEKSETFEDDLIAWLDDFRLPGNLYLWATMNSADQGVYPMDAAFKRRWSYLYKTTQEQRHKYVCIRWEEESKWLSWDALKWAINTVMENNGNIEEDRFIGPWFFKDAELEQINAFTKAEPGDRKNMPDPLTNKLFQYLRQDVFRNNPGQIFKDGYYTMSRIRMGMLNGVGINEILKIDDGNVKIKAKIDGEVCEKSIAELLKDEDPLKPAEQKEENRTSDEKSLQDQEN